MRCGLISTSRLARSLTRGLERATASLRRLWHEREAAPLWGATCRRGASMGSTAVEPRVGARVSLTTCARSILDPRACGGFGAPRVSSPAHSPRSSLLRSLGESFEGTVFTVDESIVVIEQYHGNNYDSKVRGRYSSGSLVGGCSLGGRVHASGSWWMSSAHSRCIASSRCCSRSHPRRHAVCAQASYHIVNRETVSELQELEPPPTRSEGSPEPPDLPAPNEELIKTRSERAEAKAQAEAANYNTNVTVRDQVIFSELCKTMQSDWVEQKGADSSKQCILVMGAVS